MSYRYNYYSCRRKRVTHDNRVRGLTCPKVKAGWLEELVWADVRSFLEEPGEVLQRIREQLAGGGRKRGLDERDAALSRRLAAKQAEKGRYVKLYAQGLVDDAEIELDLSNLKNQVENLKMLIASAEADLAAKDKEALVARSTEARLLTLHESLTEVEQDTEEAFEARRELAKLLVERISVGRAQDYRPRVGITYRIGPPGNPARREW